MSRNSDNSIALIGVTAEPLYQTRAAEGAQSTLIEYLADLTRTQGLRFRFNEENHCWTMGSQVSRSDANQRPLDPVLIEANLQMAPPPGQHMRLVHVPFGEKRPSIAFTEDQLSNLRGTAGGGNRLLENTITPRLQVSGNLVGVVRQCVAHYTMAHVVHDMSAMYGKLLFNALLRRSFEEHGIVPNIINAWPEDTVYCTHTLTQLTLLSLLPTPSVHIWFLDQ